MPFDMVPDFALEIVPSPGSGALINLPNAAPAGRLTWGALITTAQYVFYVLDNSTQQEWGVGLYDPVAHTITRPAVVIGNSLGTTARVTFTASARCYGGMPGSVLVNQAWGGNSGRNLLHNSSFNIVQRTWTNPLPANAYFVDRWLAQAFNGSRSPAMVAATNADRTAIGNDFVNYYLSLPFTGGAASTDYEILTQKGEYARNVTGKTITISFWAKAVSGSPKVGVNLGRSWGTGGSPAFDRQANGVAVTLSTSWVRYAVTLAIPVFTGTIGAPNTDFWQLELWLSAGANYNANSGGLTPQASTISFFGVQMEIGPAPSPYERLDHALEVTQCQRFYQVQQVTYLGNLSAGLSYGSPVTFSPIMRAAPSTITAITSGAFGSGGFTTRGAQSAPTAYGAAWGGVASSTVNGGGFIDTLGISADF